MLNLVAHTEGESRLRMFENRVLRGIFGPRKDETKREWRKLHNEELNDLYCSTTIVRVIQSRKLKRAGHVESTDVSCIQEFIRET